MAEINRQFFQAALLREEPTVSPTGAIGKYRTSDVPRGYEILFSDNNPFYLGRLIRRKEERHGAVLQDLTEYAVQAHVEAHGRPYVLHYRIYEHNSEPVGSNPFSRFVSRRMGHRENEIFSQTWIEYLDPEPVAPAPAEAPVEGAEHA